MAAPYYRMPGNKFPMQGGQPVLVDQADFEDCCCTSGAPCTDCASDNLSATVSVDGACDDVCKTADDHNPYNQNAAFDAVNCIWSVEDNTGGAPWYLSLKYTAGTWSAFLGMLTPPSSADFGDAAGGYKDLAAGVITCIGGVLAGTFDLDGIDNSGAGGPDCSGCTATVTLT